MNNVLCSQGYLSDTCPFDVMQLDQCPLRVRVRIQRLLPSCPCDVMSQLDQCPLGMPSREYFLKGRDEKALRSYEQYVVNVAVAMGASRHRAETEIAQMVEFEILLANVRLQVTTSVHESV